MLAGTSRARDEVVGRLRPTAFREFWEFTVEKVAVNAVMAGARPEYLPVILAALASGMTARSSSTTSFATIAMVNGPIRNEIAMNSGIGDLRARTTTPTRRSAAHTAWARPNLQGGSVPGETYMGSQGNSYAYSAAFAENEERSPWTPFHVQHGFEPTDSTVSLFLGGWYTQFGTDPRRHLAGALPRPACRVRSVHRSDRRARPAGGDRARRVRLRHAGEAGRLAGRELAAARRASTGTTSGCRRSCAHGRCSARSRSPPT